MATDRPPANGDPADRVRCSERLQIPDRKPDLSEYADYNTFLVDVMRHKHKEEQRRRHQQTCPELYRPVPTVREEPEPEDIDQAVAQSQRPGTVSPAETADTPSRTVGLAEEDPQRLSEQYLGASLETLRQQLDPQRADLMLLRTAELFSDPDKDMTREEQRRVFEDSRPRGPFVYPLRDPRSLSQIVHLDERFSLWVREDGSERAFSVIYVCLDCVGGPHVQGLP